MASLCTAPDMGLFRALVLISCILAARLEVTSAVVWKSADVLPDNVTLVVCGGQNVTLHWQYSRQQAEHLREEEWHFTQEGGNSDKMLAERVDGQFLPVPDNALQLEYIPNAGIRLLNVSTQDSGSYSVHTNFNLHGSIVTYTQTAHVQVTGTIVEVKNGHLVASVQPGATFNNQTNDYHLVLACSKISNPRTVASQILWTTPDNKTLQSTWWAHGIAYLSVPNPVASGDYSCSLDKASHALDCLPRNSSSLRAATVHVDGVEARLSLLEGQLQGMKGRESELENKVHTLEAENQALRQQMEFASQSVSFDVSLQTLTTSSSPLHFNDVTNNEGDAFNVTSGQFVTPLNGTYVFHMTLVSINPSSDDSDITVFLMVDGVKMVEAKTSRVSGYYNTGSVDLVKPLTQGQKVWVVNASDGHHHFTFSVHLSGILVKAGL